MDVFNDQQAGGWGFTHTTPLGPKNSLDKMDFIICMLCNIKKQTPFSLMVRTNLPLQTIYGRLGQLRLNGFVVRNTNQAQATYASWLSPTEISGGLAKWPEIHEMYPEISEFDTKKQENVTKIAKNESKYSEEKHGNTNTKPSA